MNFISIPIGNVHTRQLLNFKKFFIHSWKCDGGCDCYTRKSLFRTGENHLRVPYMLEASQEEIHEELSHREHVPNKAQSRQIRQKRASVRNERRQEAGFAVRMSHRPLQEK